MATFWQFLYSIVLLPAIRLGALFLARKKPKLRATLAGHRGLWERIEAQLANRHSDAAMVWFHVASAGEFLQALPVMERFMAAGYDCALTVTSVSGIRWVEKRRAAFPRLILVDYLPFDTRANVARLLALIRPVAVVYARYDFWPNLIFDTHRAGVPQFVIAAALNPASVRARMGLSRSFYRDLYGCMKGIYTVSAEDAEGFLRACPTHPNVRRVGDTRVDSVLERARSSTIPRLPSRVAASTVMVLGSCWPQDEPNVFPPLHQAMARFPNLLLIVAPHETDEHYVNRVLSDFAPHGAMRMSALSLQRPMRSRVIVVDTVGQLAKLYAYADIAYVGGGFGRGVHNVLEPAVMGVPVIFGPKYENSPEAVAMRADGVGFSIANGGEFARVVTDLLSDEKKRVTLGASARAYVEQHAGSAQQCFELIRAELDQISASRVG